MESYKTPTVIHILKCAGHASHVGAPDGSEVNSDLLEKAAVIYAAAIGSSACAARRSWRRSDDS